MKNVFGLFICLWLCTTNAITANNIIWGKTGHRVTGEIAQTHLSSKAKRAIKELLDGQSLAVASTYADEIKADKNYNQYIPWHYVNFPMDKNYQDQPISEQGDIIVGINSCIAVLEDGNATKMDKIFHLKMLIHFIGDLHQPLHIGLAEDKGGNDIQVQWFYNGSNLHKVWDSKIIDHYNMSYSEWAMNLDTLSRKKVKQFQEGTVLNWVSESRTLAKKVYASVKIGDKLGYRYSYDYLDEVKGQLLKGGLRLAKVLNDIYK